VRKISAWLFIAGLLTAAAAAARAEDLIFLSTQLRPIEEAQKMRNLILKGFPAQGRLRHRAARPASGAHQSRAARRHAYDRRGGRLHGELQPLVPLDALVPLDDLIA
jgi:multiple sugar transport system substrate-binding protein